MTGRRSPNLDQLTEDVVQAGLNTQFLGRRVLCFEVVDSTNSIARIQAEAGAAEGTLVLAEEQTAGRGRLGRLWLAPRGTSLLISLILRPTLAVNRAQGLTMVCSLAVREAVLEVTGLPVQLEWPNDIIVRGRKMGGILTETVIQGPGLQYAVVGIGLNVNLRPEALPVGLEATSLQHELGRTVPRLQLLQHVLVQIEHRYLALLRGEWPVKAWAAALDTLGQKVLLHTAQGECRGTAEDVDEEGALLLRRDDGELLRVLVGDIVPRRGARGKNHDTSGP